MLRHHLFNNSLDEIDVSIATNIPSPVNAIGEYTNKFSSVAHSFHAHFVILEFAVLHPIGILVVAMTEYEQRAILA